MTAFSMLFLDGDRPVGGGGSTADGGMGRWGDGVLASASAGGSETAGAGSPRNDPAANAPGVPPSPHLPIAGAVEAPDDIVALSRTNAGPIHFMGISGSGMSALAEMVLRAGGRVTGCDTNPGDVGEQLRELGAEVVDRHDPAHVLTAAAVVATAAVPQDHPELAAARRRGIPVMKRAQALGGIVNRGRLAAIAGTHGKTTTTAMTTEILAAAGLEPTGFVGGRVRGWGGGLRAGRADLFVVEADEYDRSFLRLRPEAVVVTAVEADHLDVYGSMEAVENAFAQFVGLVPETGLVAGCSDDDGARHLLGRVRGPAVLSYGTGDGAQLRAVQVELLPRGSRFRVVEKGEQLGVVDLALPGIHNVRNALGAFALARRFGAGLEAAQEALSGFRGVGRRFEQLADARGICLIDDYAHHPTEIDATVAAARGAFPGRRLVAVFQPHLYTRTRDFADAFGASLARADAVWVTDVYPARETAIPGVTGELVADAARRAGARSVQYHPEVETLAASLEAFLRPGDACLVMGAGSIGGAGRELAARLEGRS